ncbi:MAG: ABC transporter permease [Thermoanaerobaculia bacterium]
MMSPEEALASAIASLAGHKLRSALTMLGMIFGVGAVIAMLSIGEGAERQALESIERLGLSNVLIKAKSYNEGEATAVRAKSAGLSARDATALAEAVPGVELVAPRVKIDANKIRSEETKVEAQVYGISHRYPDLVPLALAEGRFFDPLDESTHAQVAILSQEVRRRLFGFGPALGRELKVDDVWLEVVGVLRATGSAPSGAGGEAGLGEIYLPFTTAQRKFQHSPLASPYDELVVRISRQVSSQRAADQMDQLLSRLHAGEKDYELVVPEALLEESRRTQRLFRYVMASIAGISLLVGGIGIMNILLATVLERTREIGVRRAVGARRRDVRLQFLSEALALAGLGGLTGILFGFGIARAVAAWAGWSTVVTPGSVLLATGVATAVGLASGLYPAARAAGLDPAEALRYE